jgi:hypothetical protein
MPSIEKRLGAAKRVKPTDATWLNVLKRADYKCEWSEAGERCGLAHGDKDPVGGGTVRLTPDHKRPHSVDPHSDPTDPGQWQALCGRHQVVKKNYWDSQTGKLNVYAIVQAAPRKEKEQVFEFLLGHFGYVRLSDGTILKKGEAL